MLPSAEAFDIFSQREGIWRAVVLRGVTWGHDPCGLPDCDPGDVDGSACGYCCD